MEGVAGLGFGCGQEVLPSLFAKYGEAITATDLPPDRAEARQWTVSGQYSLRRTHCVGTISVPMK
jgi:hypothetical protein